MTLKMTDMNVKGDFSTFLMPGYGRGEEESKEGVTTSTAIKIEREPQEGNIEYKLKIMPADTDRLSSLTSQMKWRLAEGDNEAIYKLGYDDFGNPIGLSKSDLEESLKNFTKMALDLNCEVSIKGTAVAPTSKDAKGEEERMVCELVVRKNPTEEETACEIKMAILGNVDSGKSTFVGVMCKGGLDNGRGLSRTNVFRHRHEIENGRTSSISRQVMGFDNKGAVVNYGASSWRTPSMSDIVANSSKMITFVDLAGHEKYLRTTVFGLTSQSPDYATLVLGANMGVQRMTKEHLGMAIALKIPLVIVVTKIDLAPETILKETIENMCKILKSKAAGRKRPYMVNSLDDVAVAARSVSAGIDVTGFVPIFQVSNVTGAGLDLYKAFLNLIPSQRSWEMKKKEPVMVSIDDCFNVPGVGVIVSGVISSGIVEIGTPLLLGPDSLGKFKDVSVKSIHDKQINVKRVAAGASASFSLKLPHGEKLKKVDIRKGMALVSKTTDKRLASWEFEAEVVILHHATTIKVGYEPIVHAKCVRQAAKIIKISQELIRTGDTAVCTFRFMARPEYIEEGTTVLFREGRTKGIGRIVGVKRIGDSEEI